MILADMDVLIFYIEQPKKVIKNFCCDIVTFVMLAKEGGCFKETLFSVLTGVFYVLSQFVSSEF